mgnify:CR=1 FL=1
MKKRQKIKDIVPVERSPPSERLQEKLDDISLYPSLSTSASCFFLLLNSTHTHTHTHREREREREKNKNKKTG